MAKDGWSEEQELVWASNLEHTLNDVAFHHLLGAHRVLNTSIIIALEGFPSRGGGGRVEG